MLQSFSFKKYISNGWYFLLIPKTSGNFPSIFWDGDTVEMGGVTAADLELDQSYTSQRAQIIDRGYRAWNRGLFVVSNTRALESGDGKIPVVDEYRFVRKYYKKFWVYYIYILRLLGLKNPIAETMALIQSRNMGRVKLNEPLRYEDYTAFDSSLIRSKPKVSVIIPTLNRYQYLKDAIEDLEKQTYPIHELIVIDQSNVVDEDFYKQFKIPIQLIIQKERGQWLARNAAISVCTGEWLLFFDDDSRVDADWTEQHLKGVDYFKADISAGVSLSKVGEKVPANYSFFRWADQFDSGNALVHRRVFESVGMFDRQFDLMRMGDGEFGLRAYLNGFRSISHPYAKRLHLKVSEGGLRQVGSWDAFRTKKWLAPMPIPSVSYYYLKYFDKAALNLLFFQGILSSSVPYKYKGRSYLFPFFMVINMLKLPLFLIQYRKSVKRARKMMVEGPIFDFLKK